MTIREAIESLEKITIRVESLESLEPEEGAVIFTNTTNDPSDKHSENLVFFCLFFFFQFFCFVFVCLFFWLLTVCGLSLAVYPISQRNKPVLASIK